MKPFIFVFSALLLCFSISSSAQEENNPMDKARLEAFVDANIKAVHAFETLDAKRRFPATVLARNWNTAKVPEEELKKLVELQKAMLAEPEESIIAWARGEKSSFDETKHLKIISDSKLTYENPKLPINVWVAWLRTKAPAASSAEIKAVANLQQVLVEIDRDGTILQDLFRVYNKLKLPIWTGQLGLKEITDEAFLVWGAELSEKIGTIHYDSEPATIQMALRKMYNWGNRFSGTRDKFTLGKMLIQDPEVKAAIPLLEKQPARKIAVIGHSFTMEAHWSTPGSFVPIVTELTKIYNPKTEIKYFQAGGMDARTAQRLFYDKALAYKPDLLLFVIMNEGEGDKKALKEMIEGFTAAGIKCCIFDCLWPSDWDLKPKEDDPELKGLKLNIIEVRKLLEASNEKDKFRCLDGLHLTEPWHMIMAKEWFKYLAGVRGNKL